MKIMHVASGKAYQLTPGTQLEIERPNLFFNEYGEQSLPVDLPDTGLNRELLGYPDTLTNRKKPMADTACIIHDGDFFVRARQALLGVKRGEKITTSFYMNDGAFLSKIQDVPLSTVFGEESIPGVDTVAQGLSFCTALMDGNHPDYAIFPVVYEGESADPYKRQLNKLWYDHDAKKYKLWNAEDRTIEEGSGDADVRKVFCPAGCFISPFIRALYLLRRVLSHFGYQLKDNPVIAGDEFKNIVLANNTADALLGGRIKVGQLVPDITCSELIELFRKKFCCEFHSDEVAMTVDIVFMKDIVRQHPDIDLTGCLIGPPDISFARYKRLLLKPRDVNIYAENNAMGELDGMSGVLAKYPTAYYSNYYGGFYRHRYGGDGHVEEQLCTDVLAYDDGGEIETYEVEVPETLCPDVEYRMDQALYLSRAPYIGGIRYLNSKLVKTTAAGEEEQKEDAKQLSAMLLLTYWNLQQNYGGSYLKMDVVGGLHPRNYGYITGNLGTLEDIGESIDLYAYSLCYNGAKGIYSMFWRDFDTLLRNALHKVTAELYIPQEKKYHLKPFEPVCIEGVKLLPDVLKYMIGTTNSPTESTFYTACLQDPVAYGMKAEEMNRTGYYWEWKSTETEITTEAFLSAGGVLPSGTSWTSVSNNFLYPLPPTREQYEAGGRYHETTSYICEYHLSIGAGMTPDFYYKCKKVDWWLVPMKDV